MFDGELAFCKAFQDNEAEPVAIREAACFQATYPYFFAPIQRGDLLAGRVHYLSADLSPENEAGGLLLYCHGNRMLKELDKAGATPAYRQKIVDMVKYFEDKVFIDQEIAPHTVGRMPEALPLAVLKATANSVADMGGRVAGSGLDFDKLIRLGLGGLKAEVQRHQAALAKTVVGQKYQGGSVNSARFYEGVISVLDTLSAVCDMYAAQAREMADALPDTGALTDTAARNDFALDPMRLADMGANSFDEKLAGIHANKQDLKFTGAIYADGTINNGTHIEDYLEHATWKAELFAMAESLTRIATLKPETLRDALQLAWLYAMASKTCNFGRMDVYAGDQYVADLARGISQERELKFVQSFWRMTVHRRISARETAEFNARVVVGGMGRRNPANADQFALLAMEATRTIEETEPQLTLRVFDGMDQNVMKKALDVIGEGRIYPMLYNDDINVPSVAKAFGVSREEAERYYPYGCGEYVLEHTSIGSPNCSLNTLKCLEITLHDGVDVDTGLQIGLKTGALAEFDTFEKLFAAYQKQLEYFAINLGKRHVIEYQVESEMIGLLLMSALYDGCLEKGRSLVDRGPTYTGSIIESFAMINTADSLNAIKQLVYDQKVFTLQEIVTACDANFKGFEAIHKKLRNVPKYGNDDQAADDMVNAVCNHLADYCKYSAASLGLDYFLIVNINNWYNVEIG
ncbi:MAG: pyruvate formate lyase family protein, partial [Clostridia bacterium]